MPVFSVRGPVALPSESVSTSYVTGDRTGSITVTLSAAIINVGAGPVSNLVDGDFSADNNGSIYFANSVNVAGETMKFDFGTGHVVDEAKWYQDVTTSHGSWKWQGSNDDSNWTDIGSAFTLGGSTTQTQTELNSNTTSYRYYRLLGVSGQCLDASYDKEIEFKQN